MKRLTLLLCLVLVGGASAWGLGLDGCHPATFSCPHPCLAPPSPCYTPPNPCYIPPNPRCQIVDVTHTSIVGNQYTSPFGWGLPYANGCGNIMVWGYNICAGLNIPCGGNGYPGIICP